MLTGITPGHPAIREAAVDGAMRDGGASARVVHFVLPAYNESASIGDLIDRIAEVCTGADIDYDVLVVDDGSADDTGVLARAKAPAVPVTVVRNEPNGGLGFTIRRGLRLAAEGSGPDDVIVTLDADLTQDPAYVPSMLEAMDAAPADVVIASRYRKGSGIEGLSPLRHLLSYGAAAGVTLARPIPGVRDYSCGFRAYRASAIRWGFETYGDDFVSENGFACMVEIAERLRGHATFAEVPFVLHYDAKRKESAIKILPTIGAYLRVVRHVMADRRTPWTGDVPLALPLLVVALAAFLRLFHLPTESLWNDELSTVVFTSAGPVEAIRHAAADTSPPLYYVLQSLVNGAFGMTEWTLRAISAFAGVASTALVYMVGRRLYTPLTALVASLAFAVGSMPLQYAQEARAYSLAVLFVLAAAFWLIEAVTRPRASAYAGFALAAAAAAYTHLFAGVAVAGMLAGVLVRPALARAGGWRLAAAGAAALAAWTPWAYVLAGQTATVTASADAGAWSLKAPTDVFATFYDSFSAYTPWGWTNAVVAAAFLGLVLFGALSAEEMRPGMQQGSAGMTGADRLALLGGWIGLVFGGGLAISVLVVPIFTGRMAIVAAPAIFLLAAEGARRLWRPAAIALGLAIALYAVSGLGAYYTVPQKSQWREATEYLMAEDADDVIAYTSFVLKNVSTYAKLMGDADGISGTGLSRTAGPDELADQLATALGGRDDVWVVQGHVTRAEDGTTLLDTVFADDGWRADDTLMLKDVTVTHYVAPEVGQ